MLKLAKGVLLSKIDPESCPEKERNENDVLARVSNTHNSALKDLE